MRGIVSRLLVWCLPGLCAATALASGTPSGKFFIVGMGTTPDLVTVRGAEVARSADVILVGSDQDREDWKDFIRTGEVWLCSNSLRSMYGIDPATIADPARRARVMELNKAREDLVARIAAAVRDGKRVVSLQPGDPMMYGLTFVLEMLPKDVSTEIVPGIGAFQTSSAAVKMSPPYGYDTNGVILTLPDWPGRADVNEKLMAAGSTLVFYTMGIDYPKLFADLARFYSAETPVAVVCDAGSRTAERVIRSTVDRFLRDVDYKALPVERHMLLVGKFLTVGQARKDYLQRAAPGVVKQ